MDEQQRSLLTKAREHYKRKEFERARALLEKLVEGGGTMYADVHNMLGVIHHDQGDLGRAQEQFEAALRINPNYTEAILNLTVTYNEIGRYEDARKLMEHLGQQKGPEGSERLEPYARGKIANLHAELGKLYLALGQYEEAIREYRRALAVAPEFPDLRVKLTVALREAGRLSEGLQEIERALEEHPGGIAALTQHGILLYLLGRKDKARRAWEEALYRDPLNKLIQLYLNTLDREAAAD